ncbi:MAG TPA: hemerythrin domain-containing protein [Desulfobacteria bacterium]|nr:hemerythrin domain-containing protein [Desulfobacteria bacterium]
MKVYHDDHKEVLLLLAKLEGNVMDLKAGYPSPNPYLEFEEFAQVIENVIIPHFKNEEVTVYKDVSGHGPEEQEFIKKMLMEHDALYTVFDQYFRAVKERDNQKMIEISGTLIHVLRHHILREEDDLPKLQ